MNSFDEKQPEEKDPGYEELMTLLQHANLDAMFVDPLEQAQTLARVRARLFPIDHEASQPDAHELPELGSLPSKPKAQRAKRERIVRLVNVIAAVLVVAVLIGSAQLLFGPRSPLQKDRSGTASFVEQTIGPGKVRIQAHGLELIMQVTPGPYFLGEMLAVQFTLTNHTSTSFLLNGHQCYSPLKVAVTGGESPFDTQLKSNLASMTPCTGSSGLGLIPSQFQTVTGTKYVALASSGQVTLTAQAGDQMSVQNDGELHLDPPATLFVEHVFTWKLLVQTKVPPDRVLTGFFQNGQVHIVAPPVVQGKLFYEYASDCTRNGVTRNPGTLRWEPLSTTTMHPPDCASPNLNYNGGTGTSPPKLLWWKYVVGSPGYATVAGEYQP